MSYHVYTSEGIILKRTPFGEANILLHILTEDLGLIIASAQSARVSKSKLRGALQEYAHVSVSCVKGKNGWKVTNVAQKENFFFDCPEYSRNPGSRAEHATGRRALAQVAALLMQFIPGEAPHPEIFQTVQSGFTYLLTLSEKDISSFEIVSVLRILFLLGYVAKDSDTEIFLENITEWGAILLEKAIEKRKKLLEIVNKSLILSHL